MNLYKKDKGKIHRKLNQKGYSLVELIIVLAIMGILAGASVSLFGYLAHANSKKVITSIDSTLDKLQVNSMGKKDYQYFLLYEKNGNTYYRIVNSSSEISDFSSYLSDTDGTFLSNSGIRFSYLNETGSFTDISGSNYLYISYTKKGTLSAEGSNIFGGVDTDSNYKVGQIKISGRSENYIRLVKATGKHMVQ